MTKFKLVKVTTLNAYELLDKSSPFTNMNQL